MTVSAALSWLTTWISTPTPAGTETTGGEMSPAALTVRLVSTWAPWEAACDAPWCFSLLAFGTSGGALVLVVVVDAGPSPSALKVRSSATAEFEDAVVCDEDAAGVAVACVLELDDEPPQAASPTHVTIAASDGPSLIAPSIDRSPRAVGAGRPGATRHHASPWRSPSSPPT